MVGHMRAGVTIEDPSATWIDADVEIAADATILPGTTLRGGSSIGAGSTIGPMTTLIDSSERRLVVHSYLFGRGRDEATVGPFAYPAPTRLGEGAKAGTSSRSRTPGSARAPRCPISPTSATPRWASNLGATTVTANYDGRNKNRTKIGKNVHTGVDTFVAPVEVGDEALTLGPFGDAEDVPPGALGISRASGERRGLRGEEGEGIERGRGLVSTIEQTQPITEIIQDYRSA